MACLVIPFPIELRPRLPIILGNVDYSSLYERLTQIDNHLLVSGVEGEFMDMSLKKWLAT